ncbi:unnamed protein product [Prorocentrum cordatum]|uniref:Uncharacterized protein n=1 Tax=Prorocentrum cordatum TaxID=2364126 RepID=A0ABN9UVR0_9DINO|nr:unnamed protein product [Polarella glacialis]|mmetsp:Transcript_33222/g.88181  ORF Transcript_33222/g.88181 Transcript_33222/m.88181 type:complete len:454 (-) Transcript_33222:166-1527(-)
MDEALIGWLFFGSMILWRFVSRTGKVDQVKMRKVCRSCTPFLQWYAITGLGLVVSMARTMFDVWKYDYKGANYLDPAAVEKHIQGKNVDVEDFPPWLRKVSLVAPMVGVVGFVISMWQSLRLIRGSLRANNAKYVNPEAIPENKKDLLHKCMDQLLIIIGVPLVFIVFATRALTRQWEVMTGSYCWGECVHPVHTRALVSDQCKLDMYFATAFQFYAMWEFGELVGRFMSDHRLQWNGPAIEDDDPQAIILNYRKTLKWASVLGLFAFVGIGALKSVIEFGMTVALNVLPTQSVDVNEKMALVEKKVETVFAFATFLCVFNMILISNMAPLKEALGSKINMKFHGTRTMLLVVQIQPQVLNFFVIKWSMIQTAHSQSMSHSWWQFLTHEQSILLNVTLVLYWCCFVSLANAIMWNIDDKKVARIYEKALHLKLSLSDNANNRQGNDDLRRPLV